MKELIISSRQSFLAKIQTKIAIQKIKSKYKGKIKTKYSSTIGDNDYSPRAWEINGFGVFTSSLSRMLIKGDVDVVVHSFKDLPVKNTNKTSFVCLKREDPRDVLLIKKSSLKKRKLIIGTSSPRRESSLSNLTEFLPFKEFKSIQIRGNVNTRLNKIINSKKEDGLFMAKAAIDRIFKFGKRVNNKDFQKFENNFKKFEKVILPLSEFPTAAAQGCISLEYRKNDSKIHKLLQKINHEPSFEDCIRERKYLFKWGGGCNLDIGVTIENILDKKILFAQGKVEGTNKYFKEKKYLNEIKVKKVKNIFPMNLNQYQMFERKIEKITKNLSKKNILITKGEFKDYTKLKRSRSILTSGISTWKKIRKKGLLVNSSFDGFGENHREIEPYYLDNNKPIYKLTYKNNQSKSNFPVISYYSLLPSINETTINELFIGESFYWMSFSAFKLAIQLRPDILNKRNSCGPGQTYLQISKYISKNKLNVYLNYNDFKKYELR